MASNPNLAFIRLRLDGAIALSLSLTSYVSGSQVPSRIFRCSRRGEPRDALDQLILAWERDDCRWLQGSLGPRASAALDSLLRGRTWADLRADLWHGAPGGDVAVGYRFDASDWWSRPEDTLGKEREYVALAHPESPDFETRFRDASGGDCGKHRVKFLKDPYGRRAGRPDVRSGQLRSRGAAAIDQFVRSGRFGEEQAVMRVRSTPYTTVAPARRWAR